MSKDQNPDRDSENQSEGYQDQSEQETRATRGGSSDSEPQRSQGGAERQGESSDEEDMDESEDDREDDSREGGSNRRRSIS